MEYPPGYPLQPVGGGRERRGRIKALSGEDNTGGEGIFGGTISPNLPSIVLECGWRSEICLV